MDKNIVLIDSEYEEAKDFIVALNENTDVNWSVKLCKSNEIRVSLFSEIRRYIKYFTFPLGIFLNRSKIKNGCIISWQQFYGIIYAFFCRLFHVKKNNKLIIMTFIYKPKTGILKKIYYKFIKYSIQSDYVDKIVTTTSNEIKQYAKLFHVTPDKFVYVPWGEINWKAKLGESKCKKKAIFSTGRSNRDYDFLIDTLDGTEYEVNIACDILKVSSRNNIRIYNNLYGLEMIKKMNDSYCVVITLDDPNIASGQLVFLQAMNLGKPVIVTKAHGITDDYVKDGYNGLVINKNPQELIEAISKLYSDKSLYKKLSENCIMEFQNKYSKYSLGKNISNVYNVIK